LINLRLASGDSETSFWAEAIGIAIIALRQDYSHNHLNDYSKEFMPAQLHYERTYFLYKEVQLERRQENNG